MFLVCEIVPTGQLEYFYWSGFTIPVSLALIVHGMETYVCEAYLSFVDVTIITHSHGSARVF